ncbi:MAG: hypothetical protein GY742_11410 [Hyphomicrobiales bacterium]|nr:hypothetical protein [Hyphomicrobiales bacterium]
MKKIVIAVIFASLGFSSASALPVYNWDQFKDVNHKGAIQVNAKGAKAHHQARKAKRAQIHANRQARRAVHKAKKLQRLENRKDRIEARIDKLQ